MSFEIAGRRVGAEGPLFVVAELGLNHGGSLDRALQLVDAAAEAGASAVKLQTFLADHLFAPRAVAPSHVEARSLRAFFQGFQLDEAAHHRVAERARDHGLAFVATPFSIAAVEMLERVGVDAYKIASGDITYGTLIERCAQTGRPLLLSTGMASLDEVGRAVGTASFAGTRDLALLHCVSAYPVPAGSENLSAISTLGWTFGTVTGLSDHGSDTSAVPVAVALGASVYERHLMLPGDAGVDSAVSSIPSDLAAVVATAARVKAALGHGRKECLPEEAPNVTASRRSLHAARHLRAGDVVRAIDIVALRPGTGLALEAEEQLVGARLTRRVSAGEPFEVCDLPGQEWRRDVNPLSPAVHAADGWYLVPMATDPAYVEELLAICAAERVGLLVPTIDDELAELASAAARFREVGARVAVSGPVTNRLCADKYATCAYLRAHSIPAARTYLPDGLPDAPAFPLFIKPRVGRGGVGAFPIHNERELRFFLDYVPGPVVQEFLDGPEFTIDMLCDFQGQPLSIVPRERVVIRAGVIDRGRTVRDPRLVDLARAIARVLPLAGPVNVQCRMVDGWPIVFEINPRFSGGIPLTIAAGADFPRMLLQLAAGQAVAPAVGVFTDNLWMTSHEVSTFLAADQIEGRRLRRGAPAAEAAA
jgi:sialic acid synthase SpsE